LSGAALASEFDLFAEGPNPSSYVLDDANVINKTTKKSVGDALAKLEVCKALGWASGIDLATKTRKWVDEGREQQRPVDLRQLRAPGTVV